MSIASEMLKAIGNNRMMCISILEYYLNEGVISESDCASYKKYFEHANDELEYKIQAVFGVCESRLQLKKETNNGF